MRNELPKWERTRFDVMNGNLFVIQGQFGKFLSDSKVTAWTSDLSKANVFYDLNNPYIHVTLADARSNGLVYRLHTDKYEKERTIELKFDDKPKPITPDSEIAKCYKDKVFILINEYGDRFKISEDKWVSFSSTNEVSSILRIPNLESICQESNCAIWAVPIRTDTETNTYVMNFMQVPITIWDGYKF